jgi:hypothetical protein
MVNPAYPGMEFAMNGEKILLDEKGRFECSEQNAALLLPLKFYALQDGETFSLESDETEPEGVEAAEDSVEDVEPEAEPDPEADLDEMDWNDLRSMAKERGIKTHGKKRDEIEADLAEVMAE